MKIRQGFVSNSSSSSFIAVCNKLDYHEITQKDIDSGMIWAIGYELNEGSDIFEVEDMFALHILNDIDIDFYKIYKRGYDNLNISIKELKEFGIKDEDILEIIEDWRDYKHSNSTKDVYAKYVFEEYYGMSEEQEKEYEKKRKIFFRKNKLQRVLK
jgi:hypothetical protein